MEEERTASKISRRRLIKRLGAGTAIAWLAPVVTSLGSRAEAGACRACTVDDCGCNWSCGGTLCQCGTCGPFGAAYCSSDIDGNCACWEDGFCVDFTDCTQSTDCPPGYACVPNTCCGNPKCIPTCGMGRRPRHRHGKMASGKVR